MSGTLWFVIPGHGRLSLTAVCLRHLARTCETLSAGGIAASAVVIADDENLDTARDLGFATVRRENAPLGRKWNDGYQLACDPEHNPRPADFVVPMGSDDWIDPELLFSAELPADDEILCFRRAAFVNEDATRLARLYVGYDGGLGIRVIPRALIEARRYRPAEEDRKRAIDASTWIGISRALGRPPRVRYGDLHSLQMVDWKSPGGEQLNSYESCRVFVESEVADPFGELAGFYPPDALDEMRAVYGVREEALA